MPRHWPGPIASAHSKGPRGPIEAEAHRRVDVLGAPDPLLNGEVRLVDDLAEDPAEDQTWSVGRNALDVLPEAGEVALGLAEGVRCRPRPGTISTSGASARDGIAT